MTNFSDLNIHGEAETLEILEECFIEHERIKGGYHSTFRDADNSQFISFAEKVAPHPLARIQWNWICANTDRREIAVASMFIMLLLRDDLYQGDWSDELHRIYWYFEHLASRPTVASFTPLFCGDRIANLVILKQPEERLGLSRFLNVDLPNCYAKEELIRFIESNDPGKNFVRQKHLDCVCEVLAEHIGEVRCVKDFTGELFNKLASAHAGRHGKTAPQSISIELNFYAFLANNYPELCSYEDDPYMPPAVFGNKVASKFLARGYRLQRLADTANLDPVPTYLIVPGGNGNAVIDLSPTKALSPEFRLLVARLFSEHCAYRKKGRVCAIAGAISSTCGEGDLPTDMAGDDFWDQANYIKRHYGNDQAEFRFLLSLLKSLWKLMVARYPDHDFFANSATMSGELLKKEMLGTIVMDDIPVFTYRPGIEIGCPKRFVLLLKGYGRLSTRIGDDHVAYFDMSSLGEFYRAELISFLLESPNRAASFSKGGLYSYLQGDLGHLERMKAQRRGEPSNLAHLSNSDVAAMKGIWRCLEVSEITKQSHIIAFRSFIQWEASTRGRIRFDRGALSILRTREVPAKGGRAIPDDDLEAVADALRTRAGNSLRYSLAYAIFHLALQTNLRISQICGLGVDCLRKGISPGSYLIRSTSKTSHGEYVDTVITESTYRHLMAVIEQTEHVRESCPASGPRNQIFIYESGKRDIRQVNSTEFNRLLGEACKDADVHRPFTASNLRDTFMSKAYAWGLEGNRSDLEVRKVTGHKSLRTTSSHYVDRMIDDVLERMSGVVIGEIDGVNPSDSVVARLPRKMNRDDSIVENGCGRCTLDDCANAIPTSCLMCKNFITTPRHMRAFEAELNRLNSQLATAAFSHDKDDINTKKQICALYIRQMMVITGEEVKENDRSY